MSQQSENPPKGEVVYTNMATSLKTTASCLYDDLNSVSDIKEVRTQGQLNVFVDWLMLSWANQRTCVLVMKQ